MATILVTDDHAMVREVLRSLLESHGYTVLLAPDAESAMGIFERVAIDAALVDVDMPVMNGPDLVRRLRQRSQELGRPLCAALMTGVPRPELEEAAKKAGAATVLGKPFSTVELVRLVEALCVQSARCTEAA